MNDLRHGFITTQFHPEVRLHFVEINNREHNPLIIFMHGFPEHWYAWRDYLLPLALEGYHCIALDLRGYNESSSPEAISEYTFEKLTDDIKKVITQFRNKKTFIVGHDWGGLITWELALSSPEILNGIVVMNAPLRMCAQRNIEENSWLGIKQGMRSWYVYCFQIRHLPERFLAYKNFWAIRKIFSHICAGDRERYKKAFENPRSLTAAVNYYRANLRDGRKRPKGIIKVPTLFIWGEKDAALERGLNAGMDDFFSSTLTQRFYPHASHWVHHEHQHDILNEIKFFLSIHRHVNLANEFNC